MSEAKTEEVGLVYATHLDPMRDLPRTSLYLDEEQRRASEITRARLENREPDLENPPAMQGTPLFSQAQLQAAVPRGVNLEPDVVSEFNVTETETGERGEDDTDIRYDDSEETRRENHPEEFYGANREPEPADSEDGAKGEGADPKHLPEGEVQSFDLSGTNDSDTHRQ